jgi:hypothetical protein
MIRSIVLALNYAEQKRGIRAIGRCAAAGPDHFHAWPDQAGPIPEYDRKYRRFSHSGNNTAETAPVCTENLVRFDLTTESLNVGHNGRADILPLEPVRLDLQAQEPT